MNDRKQKIDDFFNRYSILFNKALKGDPDFERTAEMFSDCCIAANPTGVNCGQNDERLRDAMQSGYDFYKKIGITSMDIISKEISRFG